MSLLFPDRADAPFDPSLSIRTAWPRHHTPALQWICGAKVTVTSSGDRATVRVPMPWLVRGGLASSLLMAAAALYTVIRHPLDLWADGAAIGLTLPLVAAGLVIRALNKRTCTIHADGASRRVTLTRLVRFRPTTETFRCGQIDSLLIVERRDLRNRRVYSMELAVDDGRNREVLAGFPPADLDRAARALRAKFASAAPASQPARLAA